MLKKAINQELGTRLWDSAQNGAEFDSYNNKVSKLSTRRAHFVYALLLMSIH